MVSDEDKYFFDLRGYVHLKQALSAEEVLALSSGLDEIPAISTGGWHGHVHAHSYNQNNGVNLQQIYEGGKPFEELIDHSAWIERVKCFVGGEGHFDNQHGPLFIDENFASIREAGESIGLHSGGFPWVKRCQYHCQDGVFNCGQINILLALTEIGPGDGATMVIPGSHKSNFRYPDMKRYSMRAEGNSVDDVEGAIEVHMNAGDALLFVDAIAHGSAKRINEGERRIIVYRYGPSWGFFRHGYRPSEALLDRLTPDRRKIVWPHEFRLKPKACKQAHVEVG